MTDQSESPDLPAIAREAQLEIEEVEAMDVAADPGSAELGYYEAALISLRDAATTLDEARHGDGHHSG